MQDALKRLQRSFSIHLKSISDELKDARKALSASQQSLDSLKKQLNEKN
jgi:hypothetical protein